MRPDENRKVVPGRESGFTLFEICIAIAMVAVGFLGVLATLSAGLSMAHRAKTNATAPMAARSAAVYFMVTGKTDDIGDSAIYSAEDLDGLYPRGWTEYHETRGDRSTPGLTEGVLPFSGYAMTIKAEKLESEVEEFDDLDSVGTTAHKLTITVYENPEDRDAGRNSVGTFHFTVYRDA